MLQGFWVTHDFWACASLVLWYLLCGPWPDRPSSLSACSLARSRTFFNLSSRNPFWPLFLPSPPRPFCLCLLHCTVIICVSPASPLGCYPPLCIPGPWPHPGQIVEAQLPLYPWTHVSEALALFLSPFAVPLMTNTPAFLSLSLGFFLSINS